MGFCCNVGNLNKRTFSKDTYPLLPSVQLFKEMDFKHIHALATRAATGPVADHAQLNPFCVGCASPEVLKIIWPSQELATEASGGPMVVKLLGCCSWEVILPSLRASRFSLILKTTDRTLFQNKSHEPGQQDCHVKAVKHGASIPAICKESIRDLT